MPTVRSLVFVTALAGGVSALTLGGCDKKADAPAKPAAAPAPAPVPAPAGASKPDDHAHAPGDGHDHGDDHGHGATTQLGEQTAGGFTIKASRDGDIKAGSDAPIDVWVTGGAAKVAAVRFWIGLEDGKGSLKAKAELEKDNWHTHVEVPNPLPEGSKLWVEVENDKAEKTVTGFDLKR
jgi:hypothetical protein